MGAPPEFSTFWPIRIIVSRDKFNRDSAWYWLQRTAWDNDQRPVDIFTTYSDHEFGFKDKKLAMEFKLRFG